MNDMLTPVILNLLQTVYAAVRLDLGIDSPNNYILHKEVMPQTLNSTFPVTATTPANPNNIGLTSHLYSSWSNPNATDSFGTDYSWMWQFLPEIVAPGPAAIQVVYLCHLQSRKSPGSLIISVLVAVLSMFSSGWAIYLLAIGTFAKRYPGCMLSFFFPCLLTEQMMFYSQLLRSPSGQKNKFRITRA